MNFQNENGRILLFLTVVVYLTAMLEKNMVHIYFSWTSREMQLLICFAFITHAHMHKDVIRQTSSSGEVQ